jgi:hypothetical protein
LGSPPASPCLLGLLLLALLGAAGSAAAAKASLAASFDRKGALALEAGAEAPLLVLASSSAPAA